MENYKSKPKKGSKTLFDNYRPIANQCVVFKALEKLILKELNNLEATNKLKFTGKQMHGFKKVNSWHITKICDCHR